jgi:hypothetical protein
VRVFVSPDGWRGVRGSKLFLSNTWTRRNVRKARKNKKNKEPQLPCCVVPYPKPTEPSGDDNEGRMSAAEIYQVPKPYDSGWSDNR